MSYNTRMLRKLKNIITDLHSLRNIFFRGEEHTYRPTILFRSEVHPVANRPSLWIQRRAAREPIDKNESPVSAQRNVFRELGLDYDKGKEHLSTMMEVNDASSEHFILFSALSLKWKDRRNQRILEIGTYSGETTALLSRLFPDSSIKTIDLPDDDKDALAPLRGYTKEREKNLKQSNIEFLQVDSFHLMSRDIEKFDLIWIDGDHSAPTVITDLYCAYHLLESDGIIAYDDVFVNEILERTWENAAIKTLEAYQKRRLINYWLVHKRLTTTNSALHKFVAVVKKAHIPEE